MVELKAVWVTVWIAAIVRVAIGGRCDILQVGRNHARETYGRESPRVWSIEATLFQVLLQNAD